MGDCGIFVRAKVGVQITLNSSQFPFSLIIQTHEWEAGCLLPSNKNVSFSPADILHAWLRYPQGPPHLAGLWQKHPLSILLTARRKPWHHPQAQRLGTSAMSALTSLVFSLPGVGRVDMHEMLQDSFCFQVDRQVVSLTSIILCVYIIYIYI